MEYIVGNINDFDNEYIENFYDKIPIIKRNRIGKYKSKMARVRSIVGEMLLSKLLSCYNISYDDIDYIVNEYGKPYIKNCNLFFNISHSFDYVVVVVSDKEIGIDIERIRDVHDGSINRVATDKEKEYIFGLSGFISEHFFKIYSLKEAYFKMLGVNLDNILNVEFIFDENMVICSDEDVNVLFVNKFGEYVISCCEKK